MTLARADSVELYGQARLQGIKKMAGGEGAEEVCVEHSERLGSNRRAEMIPEAVGPGKDVCSYLMEEELSKGMTFPE